MLNVYENEEFRKVVADFLTTDIDGGATDGIVEETFKWIKVIEEKLNRGESHIVLEDLNVWCGTLDVIDAMFDLFGNYEWSEKLSKPDDYIHVYVKRDN